jgi:hypothetical protein
VSCFGTPAFFVLFPGPNAPRPPVVLPSYFRIILDGLSYPVGGLPPPDRGYGITNLQKSTRLVRLLSALSVLPPVVSDLRKLTQLAPGLWLEPFLWGVRILCSRGALGTHLGDVECALSSGQHPFLAGVF